MYEIKILPNRRLTTPLFCKHALRSNLECEIGTAVEPLREKNNNVKSIREDIICFFSLSKYLFCAAILSMYIKRFQSISTTIANGSFVLVNFKSLRATGWKTLKLHQLQQIISFIWKFEIYIRKLIKRIESWFWSFTEGMNGITDAHIFVLNDQNQLSVRKCYNQLKIVDTICIFERIFM